MEIFTKTAIEAMILDQGVEAQSILAAMLRGTPALVGFAALIWVVHLLRGMAAVGLEGRLPQAVGYQFAIVTLVAALGWTLLGVESRQPLQASPIDAPDRTWEDLPGISATPAYERLRRPARGLWGFGAINGVFEEASQVLTASMGVSPNENPADFARTMVQMQATTLSQTNDGEGVLQSFDALARNCARNEPLLVGQGAEIRDLFVRTVDELDPDTGIDCAQLWRDFEEETVRVAYGATADEGGWFGEGWLAQFGLVRFAELGVEYFGLDEDETLQWGKNVLVEGTLREAAKRGSSTLNPLRKDEATFTESWPDYIVEVLVDGPTEEIGTSVGSLFDPNLALRVQKAEAATKFNEIADMIPTMRGFLFAGFAAAFPLCAYAMCLGAWAPMRNWLVGRAILALYMPAAHFLYGIVNQFAAWNHIADNPDMAWLHSSQAVVGALSVLEAETLRVQTAYLVCEVAVFGSFALGSASALFIGGIGLPGRGLSRFVGGVRTVVQQGVAAGQVVALGAASAGGAEAATARVAVGPASPPPPPPPPAGGAVPASSPVTASPMSAGTGAASGVAPSPPATAAPTTSRPLFVSGDEPDAPTDRRST